MGKVRALVHEHCRAISANCGFNNVTLALEKPAEQRVPKASPAAGYLSGSRYPWLL